MIKEFRAKRAEKKRVQRKVAAYAEMKAMQKDGHDRIIADSQKYFKSEKQQKEWQQRMWSGWFTFLDGTEKEKYLAAAELWYRLRFGDDEGNLPEGDLTYSGVTKEELIEVEDLRRRMWETLYPDEVERHMKAIQVQEDKHVEVTFERKGDRMIVVRNGVADPLPAKKK